MKWWNKAFSLNDIKYYWLLVLSIVLCGAFVYWDRMDSPDKTLWLSVGYGASFGLAVLWSGANYVGHIRINAMYRKHNDIQAYVEQLAMNDEDKMELRNYLEDYTQDLMSQGKTKEQATAEAISQFKVKELLSLSKHTSLFDLHAHHYLLGWAAVAFVLLLLLELLDGLLFSHSLLTMIVESILAAYGAAFIMLFFIYKVLDVWVYRKLNSHLS
ncbi:hypothetical protein FE784_31100 [Paenibacillus hemerocallicola]|uniref:Uncharacterized protein n=1 Tax=Paenibacillus hemerocallicola TaxID=1172614 RepID=A0A5C4T233_9BACL|nr:hypothetical protein [Paenibacillus hemerocallicola]TNJ62337.1 hypothetical protein FE784_31100 [Paenibacillus hemerocallicola]